MATQNQMLSLMGNYTRQLNQMNQVNNVYMSIVNNVDLSRTAITNASQSTAVYNTSLQETEKAAVKAESGIIKLIKSVNIFDSAKKAMNLTDSYMKTASALNTINDGTQTQTELQKKVFASANRSRVDYADMAASAAKVSSLAGGDFAANDEAIGFTELLMKSIKATGAGTSDQQSSFSRITDAMGDGEIQGDEFSAMMTAAPMAADALASYTGKSTKELMAMAEQGLITAQLMKQAMFYAADDINGKFGKLPATFEEVWSRLRNAGTEAFGGVMEQLSQMLNSDMGQGAINMLINVLYAAADVAGVFMEGLSGIYNFISNNWPAIYPIVLGIAAGFITYAVAQTAAAAAQWAMNTALFSCPIFLVALGVGLAIAAFYAAVEAINQFAGTSVSATGIIGGVFGTLGGIILNVIFYLWNGFADLANFIGNVMTNPAAAIKILFYDTASTVLGFIETIASAIETVINFIPGVKVDITSNLSNLKSSFEKEAAVIKDESGWKEYVKRKEYVDITGAAAFGYDMGAGLEDSVGGLFSGLTDGNPFENLSLSNGGDPFKDGGFGSQSNPAAVKGTGAGGAVKVENNEDIEWMRKLAERDFVARIATNTLAPNIKIDFTGPITKEADVNGVAVHIGELLKEQIAVAPEGVYV